MNGLSAAATAPKEAPRVKGPIVWLDMDQPRTRRRLRSARLRAEPRSIDQAAHYQQRGGA